MATYVAGDVQGCLAPLKQLLNTVDFMPEHDTLWLTGDLVNRGPQSLETLRFLYDMQDSIITVLGNHDLHLLAVAAGLKRASPSDTFDAILQAPDKNRLTAWLRQQPILHHDPVLQYTLVHAGIPPQWDLQQALQRAQEVEAVLRGDAAPDFFQSMYGNEPDSWHSELTGQVRWRVITNYFTRMRFCTDQGALELKNKSGIDQAPAGHLPWFQHAHRKTANERIVFGHWAALAGDTVQSQNVFAMDTGCVWGGAMTMMCLETQQRFSVPCHG